MTTRHTFATELFIWDASAPSSWFFVTVPEEPSEALRAEAIGEPRGFGSIKVQASIGATMWATSIFPSTDRERCYVLPVKKAVRVAEGLHDGDPVEVTLRAIEP